MVSMGHRAHRPLATPAVAASGLRLQPPACGCSLRRAQRLQPPQSNGWGVSHVPVPRGERAYDCSPWLCALLSARYARELQRKRTPPEGHLRAPDGQ
jgi:hypothetical protein